MNQYRGYCRSIAGSSIIYGDISASFSVASIGIGDLFRFDYSKAPTYVIATKLSATRLQLTEKVTASRAGYPFTITRDLTTYRNYAKIYQGDTSVADILREQIVDKVDQDVGKIYNATASVYNLRLVSDNTFYRLLLGSFGDPDLYISKKNISRAIIKATTGSWVPI